MQSGLVHSWIGTSVALIAWGPATTDRVGVVPCAPGTGGLLSTYAPARLRTRTKKRLQSETAA